jgi:hypothetical protein
MAAAAAAAARTAGAGAASASPARSATSRGGRTAGTSSAVSPSLYAPPQAPGFISPTTRFVQKLLRLMEGGGGT